MIENPTDRIVAEAKAALRDGTVTDELVASLMGEILELDRLYHTEVGKVRDLRKRLQNSSAGIDTRGLDGDPRDRPVPQEFSHVEGWHDR